MQPGTQKYDIILLITAFVLPTQPEENGCHVNIVFTKGKMGKICSTTTESRVVSFYGLLRSAVYLECILKTCF